MNVEHAGRKPDREIYFFRYDILYVCRTCQNQLSRLQEKD